MRKPIIVGNWKMFKTVNEALLMTKELKKLICNVNTEVVICPPFTALYVVKQQLIKSNIKVGAQDLYWENEGAFTGQISPNMIVEVGCDYVIVGHSERRQYFGETNITINKKLKAALKVGLVPILCVGETISQRTSNITNKVIYSQILGALAGLKSDEVAKIVIAYEPVWVIGTGQSISAVEANIVCSFIRQIINEILGNTVAETIRIQYGGSIKSENIKEFMTKSNIDGVLVGGASLNPYIFSDIIKYKCR